MRARAIFVYKEPPKICLCRSHIELTAKALGSEMSAYINALEILPSIQVSNDR